jgi:hypothetical protein
MFEAPIESIAAQYGIYAQMHDYKMIPVFQNTTPEVRLHIIRLWENNGIFFPPGIRMEERAKQVVFLVVGPQNNLVAVNSAYIDDLLETGIKNAPPDKFYFYRMFIQPKDRVFNLAKKMIVSSYEYLKALPVEEAPKGVIMVAENQKLVKRAVQRGFKSIGWHSIGHDLGGNMILRRDF